MEPPLPEKGLKAKKGSVKLGTGLQYVEVAVDKVPLSPPQTSSAGGIQSNSKTQYAEVLLPPNGSVEEVDECEELPQLPSKNNKKPKEPEDIWVRNTPAKPPPSLPPKTRTKSDAADSERPAAKTGRPPAALPPDTEPDVNPAGASNPGGQSDVGVSEQATRRVASPELSRKGYEDMNLSGRATPPAAEDIWKPQPVNMREHPKQQPLAYENVSLPHKGKPPNDMQSMIITDVDQQGEGEDGYVVVNQQPSKPPDARGYENVTPGTVMQSAVTPGAASPAVKHSAYENVSKNDYYVPMIGGMQTERQSTQAAGEKENENNPGKNFTDPSKKSSVPLSSFHLNGHILGFYTRTQKFEPPCIA